MSYIDDVYAKDNIKLGLSASSKECQVGKEIEIEFYTDSNKYSQYEAGLELTLNYDPNVLEFVEGQKAKKTKDGTILVQFDTFLKGRKSFFIKMKGLKDGKTTLSINDESLKKLKNYVAFSIKPEDIVLEKSKLDINVGNGGLNGSSQTYLSSLKIKNAKLQPEFKQDVFEYNAIVENDVSKLDIEAVPVNKNCKAYWDKDFILESGKNNVLTITVKDPSDQNLGESTYTISVFRRDYMQQDTTVSENESDKIHGVEEIQGKLVLKGMYHYQIVDVDNESIIPKGYEQIEYSFDNNEVTAYAQKNVDSDFILIYAKNLDTDKTDFYQYDKEEETFQKYCKDYRVKSSEEKGENLADIIAGKKTVFVAIISILSIFFIGFVTYAIILKLKIRKINKKEFDGQKLY